MKPAQQHDARSVIIPIYPPTPAACWGSAPEKHCMITETETGDRESEKQTETDRDRRKQTETNRDRQRQAETSRDRQGDRDRQREKETETDRD